MSQLSAMPRVSVFKQAVFLFALALAIVLPRSMGIVANTTDTFDECWHFSNGLWLYEGKFDSLLVNDTFTGAAIESLPAYAAGARTGDTPFREMFHKQPVSAGTIRTLAAVWNSLLFCAFVVLAYTIARRVYGDAAGWVAALALLIEPTFAAHTPLYTLDVLGVETIALACYMAWRYFAQPSKQRAIAAGACTGLAVCIKFTAMGVPVAIVFFAILWWIVKPIRDKEPFALWKKGIGWRMGHLSLMAATALFSVWALNRFETGPLPFGPVFRASHGAMVNRIIDLPWPAPHYLYSFLHGFQHDRAGHPSILWGEFSFHGRWYYFPVLATYKIPLGIIGLLLLGALSLFKKRFVWHDWAVFVPVLVWTFLLIRTNINSGFRHFLAPYFFMIVWASRCAALSTRPWRIAVIACLLLAAAHVATWYPNFMAYFNFPRANRFLDVADSNVDWGQGLKQVGPWLEKNPPTAEKPVYLCYFGSMPREFARDIPGRTFTPVADWNYRDAAGMAKLNRPTRGVLIVSQSHYAALVDRRDPWRTLRRYPPKAVIAESMLVWDLDALGPDFKWDELLPVETTAQVNEPREKMDASIWAMIQLYRVE